ncbi:MAG TPA: hypothetical protein VH951_05510 [Dehalococcoidia bacterium]
MIAARRMLTFEAARGHSRPADTLDLRFDLPGVLLAGAVLTAGIVAIAALALVFRMAAQFTAWSDIGWPWAWVYALGGVFEAPFRSFEGGTNAAGARSVFEISNLLALEAYLLCGLILVGSLVALSLLARRSEMPEWVISVDQAKWRARYQRADSAVGAMTRTGAASAATAAQRFAAGARDFERSLLSTARR